MLTSIEQTSVRVNRFHYTDSQTIKLMYILEQTEICLFLEYFLKSRMPPKLEYQTSCSSSVV